MAGVNNCTHNVLFSCICFTSAFNSQELGQVFFRFTNHMAQELGASFQSLCWPCSSHLANLCNPSECKLPPK